jgi:nucleoside-diphosphate-sugar epimerase
MIGKVLLTGGNGFVGSRVLARLLGLQVPVLLLLRASSRLDLIHDLLPMVEVRQGSVEHLPSLQSALEGATAVIHCAGRTKALRSFEFERVNVGGTRNLIEAINQRGRQIRRMVHLSSLAATGPATAEHAAREQDAPSPVSAYGRSKLAGETVARGCKTEIVILRPAAVYGPGDTDFLKLFKSIKSGFSPRFGGGRQPLSLVYADDLADITVDCLTAPAAAGRAYHVAHPEVVTARQLACEIATQMQRRPLPIPLPAWTLLPISWIGQFISACTRKPGILSIDRRRELVAPGWVCDTSRLSRELGLQCSTGLADGLRLSLEWYREAGWL